MSKANVVQLNKQGGAVLAVSLLILLVLTFVAVTAMEGSSLGFKMSANSVFHDEAFNNSESARMATIGVVDEYLYEGDWQEVAMPTGLTVDSNGAKLALENGNTEDRYNNASLQKDLSYSASGITGDIYVLKGPTVLNTSGAGAAQYKGYGGTGIAAGAPGGSVKYYEFRSVGTSKSNAKSWTASDYKYVQ